MGYGIAIHSRAGCHRRTELWRPMSRISDGTVLRVLKRTSVPGCCLKMGAVMTEVLVSWRWCLMFLPARPLDCFSGHGWHLRDDIVTSRALQEIRVLRHAVLFLKLALFNSVGLLVDP
jgi:hypothetical protein